MVTLAHCSGCELVSGGFCVRVPQVLHEPNPPLPALVEAHVSAISLREVLGVARVSLVKPLLVEDRRRLISERLSAARTMLETTGDVGAPCGKRDSWQQI